MNNFEVCPPTKLHTGPMQWLIHTINPDIHVIKHPDTECILKVFKF